MIILQKIRWVKLFIIVLLGTTTLYGCAQIRKLTYPPEFVYLDQKEVTNKMVLLSIYIRQIDKILSRADTVSSEDQVRILENLSLINTTTDLLGAGSRYTNHLVIDDHIDQFKSNVIGAISAAKAKPPNYYPAGQLSGSCNACHQFRNL